MPAPRTERVQVVFRGRVQGVGFRAATRDAARGFAVTGWVRNEPDGSVRCQVQGAADQVAAMLAEVRRRMGPLITGESSSAEPIDPDESGFEIRR